MRYTKIFVGFIVILMLFMAKNIYAETTVDSMNINIRSSVDIDLISNYEVNAFNIIVGSKENLEIISGQDLLLKYRFVNNLNYDYEIEFWFSSISEDLSEYIDLLVIEEVISEKECSQKKGELFKKNNQVVEVYSNNKTTYLCVVENLKELPKVNIFLKPGENYKYFLLSSKPTVLGKEGVTYSINSFVDIKEPEIIEEASAKEGVDKLNPNFSDSALNSDAAKRAAEGVVDTTKNIKSGISGFVSGGVSPLIVVLIGLLLVVVIASLVTKKKKKYQNMDDLNKL